MKTIIILLIIISNAAHLKAAMIEDKFKPLRIGFSNRDYADSSRSNWLGNGPRPLRSVIWYPAGKGGKAEIFNDSSQVPSPVTFFRDAGISGKKKKYPLILISHGSQGNALQMNWLGICLASRGYICVAINHNGTDEEERKTDFMSLSDFCIWERPKDISAVLDQMLKDPLFSAKIDTGRIACAGFSLGGSTAIWVAGAIPDLGALANKEAEPPPFIKASVDRLIELSKTDTIIINSGTHAEESFADTRIKAVFALAPAIGQGFTIESLNSIKVPVQIVVGDADIIAPMEPNAEHLSKNINTAKPLIILPGERGHYLKPSVGNERAFELREVSRLAYHFFEEMLK